MSTRCTICGKQLKRLTRHLRTAHNLLTSGEEAHTLKEFLKLCTLIPLNNKEWNLILKNDKSISNFIKHGEELPCDIFATCYQAYERYQTTPGAKLIILKQNPVPSSLENVKRGGSSQCDKQSGGSGIE